MTMVIPLHKFKAAAADESKPAGECLADFSITVWNTDLSFTVT